MNDIGNTILSTEEGKEKYDEALKELLANKQFLARILKRFVKEFAPYPLEDIEDKYIEPNSILVSKLGVERNLTNIEGLSNEDRPLNEGHVTYDIVFRACYPGKEEKYIGLYFIVEAQNTTYPGYPLEMRGFYYAARRLSAQLKSINKDTDYGSLQKVYSIWLCAGDVPNYEAGTVTLYETTKCDIIGYVKRDVAVYDLMSVIIIRINDKMQSDDEVLTLLQTLCSQLLTKEEKLERLRNYDIRLDENEEVDTMCNLSDYIEQCGITKGELLANKRVALNMLKDGMPYEKVAEYTTESVETIRQWEQEVLATV